MLHYQGGPLGIYAIAHAINVFDMIIELVKSGNAKVSRGASQNPNQYAYYHLTATTAPSPIP